MVKQRAGRGRGVVYEVRADGRLSTTACGRAPRRNHQAEMDASMWMMSSLAKSAVNRDSLSTYRAPGFINNYDALGKTREDGAFYRLFAGGSGHDGSGHGWVRP